MEKLNCHPDPCLTCPYRRDTPAGVWHAAEYMKLPAWDDEQAFAGVFLCHTDQSAVCRGWMEVHQDNLHVRLTMTKIEWDERNKEPTKVPLYESGGEACLMGLAGVERPGAEARAAIMKLLKKAGTGQKAT